MLPLNINPACDQAESNRRDLHGKQAGYRNLLAAKSDPA